MSSTRTDSVTRATYFAPLVAPDPGIYVLRGDGSGAFSTPLRLSTATLFTVGDVTGDGRADVVVVRAGSSASTVATVSGITVVTVTLLVSLAIYGSNGNFNLSG